VFSNGEGHGSTFFFELPIAADTTVQSSTPTPASGLVEPSFVAGPKLEYSVSLIADEKPQLERNHGLKRSRIGPSSEKVFPARRNDNGDDLLENVAINDCGSPLIMEDINEYSSLNVSTSNIPFQTKMTSPPRSRHILTRSSSGADRADAILVRQGSLTSSHDHLRPQDGQEQAETFNLNISSTFSFASGYCLSKSKPKSTIISVLLVDDAGSNRKMVSRVLDKSLFSVEEAEDGLVALSKVNQMMESGECPFDVILMDFMMPTMDGPTATRAIRGLGYKGIIIGVTGNSAPQDILLFTSSGADLVLSKPLDVDLLTTTIQSRLCSLILVCPVAPTVVFISAPFAFLTCIVVKGVCVPSSLTMQYFAI